MRKKNLKIIDREEDQQEGQDFKMETPRLIIIPSFSGKKKYYNLWIGKFVAFCHVKNCDSNLVENGDPDLPTYSENTSSDVDTKNLEEKAVIKNTLAMSYLTMVLTNASCQVMIHKSNIESIKYR